MFPQGLSSYLLDSVNSETGFADFSFISLFHDFMVAYCPKAEPAAHKAMDNTVKIAVRFIFGLISYLLLHISR